MRPKPSTDAVNRGQVPASLAPLVHIHESVIGASVKILRQYKDERSAHEGIVYWAGRDWAQEWFVTTCIAPRATTTRGSFETSRQSNAEVIAFLASTGLHLLGQVHSHPGSIVDHSRGDEEGALMPYENYLSIVVPHYGKKGMWPLGGCGVHRFEHGRFRRLRNDEVTVGFRAIPTSCDRRSS